MRTTIPYIEIYLVYVATQRFGRMDLLEDEWRNRLRRGGTWHPLGVLPGVGGIGQQNCPATERDLLRVVSRARKDQHKMIDEGNCVLPWSVLESYHGVPNKDDKRGACRQHDAETPSTLIYCHNELSLLPSRPTHGSSAWVCESLMCTEGGPLRGHCCFRYRIPLPICFCQSSLPESIQADD